MTTTSTIVIADDHPILRVGLQERLEATGTFVVVGSTGDAQTAVNLCRELQPDLLMLDVEMPGRDSLGALGDIKACSPSTRIVVLTAYCRDPIIEVALSHGVAGYLLKTDAPADILDSLARVMKGEPAYSKEVSTRISRPVHATRRGSGVTLLSTLSPRELEVLRYIGKGLDNATMAEAMHLSIRTVERHVLRLMRRLKINDRTRLTALAHESGLVG